MASQKTIYVTGAIKHLIFYDYRGTPSCRMRPSKVNQTAATRTCGKQFGQAARLSRILRTGIASLLPDTRDKDMLYRLNNVFYQWLRTEQNSQLPSSNLHFLQDFPFTTETLFSSICQSSITVNWEQPDQVQVTIPAIISSEKKTAPPGTQKLLWKVAICSCPLTANATAGSPHITAWDIPYNAESIPAQEITPPYTVQSGAITIVTAALEYEHPKQLQAQLTGDKRWRPMGIIGSYYKPEQAAV